MNRKTALPHSVVLVLGLAVMLNYVDRANLSTAAPLLQNELSLSNVRMGVLFSAFFWVYTPAQLLGGWLVHRFNVRAVLAAGLLLWAVATVLTGFAGGFASILVFRLVLALGECVMFPSWQVILARHTLEHERGRANGFIGSGQGIGPMLGTLFGGLAMARFGWRAMFIGLGVITLFWIWPWLMVTRRGFSDAHDEHGPPPVSYGAILRQREFWGAAIGHFSINYGFYFVFSWLPTFLIKAGGFTVEQMSGIAAAIYGVYAVTTALAGAISDRWIARGSSPTRVRKGLLLASAVGVAVAIAGSAYVKPQAAVWLLGAAGVCFGLSTPTAFAVTTTLAGPRAAGRWAGAQNVAGQLAGVLSPLVTGFLIDRTGNFSWAFIVCAASAVVAMVAWCFVIRQVATVEWPEGLALIPVERHAAN
jgi:MFS family permease